MNHGQEENSASTRKYKHITHNQRHTIQTLRTKGMSAKEIATMLDVHRSTIYRELKRGRVEHKRSDLSTYITYSADRAILQSDENSSAKGPKLKIGSHQNLVNDLRILMTTGKCSPYAALQECRKKYSSEYDKSHIPCEKTIYNYIHQFGFPIVAQQMIHTRNKQKAKRPLRRQGFKSRAELSIEKRPRSVNNREEIGHHEIDLVVGAQGTKACLLVITERSTRFEHIILLSDKTQQSVRKGLNKLETHYGERFKELFISFTSDNGSEFLDPEAITKSRWGKSTRCSLYYAHPYCSSERGSNENANRLIRRFLPKGRSLEDLNQETVSSIARWMNNYPRKLFNGNTAKSLAKQFTFHDNIA